MTYIQYTYFSPFNHEILSHLLPRPSTSYWPGLPKEMNENIWRNQILWSHGTEVKTNLFFSPLEELNYESNTYAGPGI